MSYDFSFDKKSVFRIVAGCCSVGLLLFFAGFILGLDRGETLTRLEFQKQNAPRIAKAVPAQPPAQETKMQAEATPEAPTAAVSESNPPAESAPQSDDNQAAVLAKTMPAVTPGKEAPPQEAAAPQPAKKEEAKPSPASLPQSDQPPAATPALDAFSIQIGAFHSEENAQRLQHTLKSRGYSVFVFDTLDGHGNVWHTVRMGHFKNMEKAGQAAVAFSGREQLPAYVRPSNEL